MFAGTACTPESILQSAFDGFREARRVVAMLLQLLGPVEDARSEQLQALLRISSQNMVAVKVGEPACCEFCAFKIKLPPAFFRHLHRHLALRKVILPHYYVGRERWCGGLLVCSSCVC